MLFQAIVALGLPMCHVYTVSGSSLPDKTFVSSLSDQFKLQAKVSSSCWVADTASGQNRWSFLFSRHKSVGERACPHIQNNLVMGSLIPRTYGLREATVQCLTASRHSFRPTVIWTIIVKSDSRNALQSTGHSALLMPLFSIPRKPNSPDMLSRGGFFH